jgi:hypothetical protein
MIFSLPLKIKLIICKLGILAGGIAYVPGPGFGVFPPKY